MSDLKDKFDSAKDKIMGNAKENVGKATGSEETELKGKAQSQTGEFKEKFGEFKEKIAKKINDTLDKNEENKQILFKKIYFGKKINKQKNFGEI